MQDTGVQDLVIAAYEQRIQALQARVQDLESDGLAEHAVINRVWAALGVTTYAQTGGHEISALVAEAVAHRRMADERIAALELEGQHWKDRALAAQDIIPRLRVALDQQMATSGRVSHGNTNVLELFDVAANVIEEAARGATVTS